MAYTDDWESLMNGVFGAGGRVKFGSGAAQPDTKAKTGGLPDLNAALLEQQKQLDELLKKQNAQLKKQDADTQTALENSRQMLRDMENDGLLAKGTADTKPEHLGSFEGLATEVKKTVLGQDAFVDGVVRAMRRPFVLGTEAPVARNVILLSGAPGTGRHFALEETARIMAARGLLQSDKTAVLDLALYPDAGSEKLFLQDLYAALHAPGEILIFEHYESCYPGFLKTIADLATRGSAPLSSRYLVNKEGILVDAGTALAPGAVSRIDPCGKYLIFFSHKGREVLADKFGAPFVSAVGDVCTTTAFAREDLAAMAAQELNALARKVRTRLGLTLTAGADVRDYVAAQCSKEKGAAGLKLCCDRIFHALSEYCLQTDTALTGTVALTAVPEGLQFALNGAAPADLFSLLPTEYTGAVDEIRAELDALVGLAPVKDYVFGLADNLQVQQRRAAAGFKTASLSMHMIFTGNPGTGKTTIARLVAKYLKAIGALKGGQLVEVSRGDLVGRYTGHTAPLTNSVIQSALGGVLFIDEALQPVPRRTGQLRAGSHRHPCEGHGGPPRRAGGDLGRVHQRDGRVPHRQQRPCQPLPEQGGIPGLHRRRAAGHYHRAGQRQGLPAGRKLHLPAAGLLQAPSGAGQPHRRQRSPCPQHAGKGHLQPEPPPCGRAQRPAGPDLAQRPGI